MLESAIYMQGLTDQEKMLFQHEYSKMEKRVGAAQAWCFFLGGGGAHRFYMGDNLLGFLYLMLCWTGVPAIVALVEVFLMKGRVRSHNDKCAAEIALKIKSIRSPQQPVAIAA